MPLNKETGTFKKEQVIGKESCKLRNNEKNTDISLYMYLPKLHENILKYSRLNLFKEITIGFRHNVQTASESPASLFDSLLVSAG